MKAVSDKLFSSAIFCMTLLGKGAVKITAAGLPSNNVFVKAST